MEMIEEGRFQGWKITWVDAGQAKAKRIPPLIADLQPHWLDATVGQRHSEKPLTLPVV
jgi:hypothetical protein